MLSLFHLSIMNPITISYTKFDQDKTQIVMSKPKTCVDGHVGDILLAIPKQVFGSNLVVQTSVIRKQCQNVKK